MGKGVSFSAFGNGRQKISGVRGLFQGQNIHTFFKGHFGSTDEEIRDHARENDDLFLVYLPLRILET